MEELNIKDFINVAKKKLWIIILITIITTSAGIFVSYKVLDSEYRVNTTLYIGTKITPQSDGVAYQDLLMGGQLVKDYIELAKSRLVRGIVKEELESEGHSLVGLMSVHQKGDTRIIEITVQDTSPKLATLVANKYAEVFKRKALELIDAVNIQIIDVARTPSNPIKPNKKMNIVFSFMLGVMISVVIIFLIVFLDNTIKTSEDIEGSIKLIVIGSIPKF